MIKKTAGPWYCGFFFTLLIVTFASMPMQAWAGPSDNPIELKFAYHTPPKASTTVKWVEPWKRKAEEATRGKVKITSYPAQSLAKAREIVAAIEGGVTDIGWIVPGYFPGRFPLTEVITLPFVATPSAEKNGRILQELYETTPAFKKEWASMKLLYLVCTTPYFIATNEKPVRNMGDLKGLKIRVDGSVPSKAAKRLGATPVFLPVPGIYEAAEKGVIDGSVQMWAMVATFRTYEVFKYWTDVSLWPAAIAIAMNLDKWNSLPPDVQKGIMSVSGAHGSAFAGRTAWGPHLQPEVYARAEKAGKKFEKISLDKGELEKWKNVAGKPILDEWVKRMEKKGLPGREVLNKALKLADQYR